MRCLYPTIAHMQAAVFELTGRHQGLPFFKEVRVDQAWARYNLLALHRALSGEASTLERESHFTWTLARLVLHYADLHYSEGQPGKEQKAIQQIRSYIEECYSQSLSLHDLAEKVSLSPYYLLRAFQAEAGLTPHAYQESVRIRHAQQLIKSGLPLAKVAAEVGFSSQSHLTRRFKQIIGVTPGQYAGQVK
jgi:AraC-like DNA-binding protein